MFGADTPLVMDALQIAAIAIGVGIGASFLIFRRLNKSAQPQEGQSGGAQDLSKRVEVLERIATDQSIGLADEIEALRDAPAALEKRA